MTNPVYTLSSTWCVTAFGPGSAACVEVGPHAGRDAVAEGMQEFGGMRSKSGHAVVLFAAFDAPPRALWLSS